MRNPTYKTDLNINNNRSRKTIARHQHNDIAH